ncbi:hypothetical protein KSP39_PZI010181 [Platanthera zijinensis]|uniref:Phytocyanin domain-containing protein n=1 Tax=Platanthera zijinensis TaxID=2320716 RepID=A0AAP0G6I5_9ASPA
MAARALVALAAIAVAFQLAAATNYTVGAPAGSWDLKTNYSTWASGITFKTGDNLVFSYSPALHNVLEVTKANFDSCTTAGPIKTHSSGNDVIPLSSPGNRYFICGVPTHCASGMKLDVDTTAATSSGSPPPSGSPLPFGSPPPSGSPPSGSTPSTPTTPLTPEGSPAGITPSGSTPEGPSAAGRLKVAAAGLMGVGMLIAFAF